MSPPFTQPAAQGLHRHIAAAADDGNPRLEPQIARGVGRQGPDDIRSLDDAWQMGRSDTVPTTERAAPAPSASARVVQKRGMGTVFRHRGATRTAQGKVISYVQPPSESRKPFRLVFAHPEVFPHRVFHTGRHATGQVQGGRQQPRVDAGDTRRTAEHALPLRLSTLIQVSHRGPQ